MSLKDLLPRPGKKTMENEKTVNLTDLKTTTQTLFGSVDQDEEALGVEAEDSQTNDSTVVGEKSIHKVEVVRINEIKDHPNAHKFGIVQVWGYSVCVQLDAWKVGDLAAYIPPDSVCPDTPEFEWMGENKRVCVKRLGGYLSYGFLNPAPEGAKEGDDVTEQLGVTHYEPPIESSYKISGEHGKPPPGHFPKYEVNAFKRYSHLLVPGEEVHVSEKIHGAQIRMCYRNDEFFVGSRNMWINDDPGNLYWIAFRRDRMIQEFLKKNPDMTLYGEVVPCYKVGGEWFDYGLVGGKPAILLFDAKVHDRFMNATEAREYCGGMRWVPEIAKSIKFDLDSIYNLCSGQTRVHPGTHIREGVVIRPVVERSHPKVGRVILKLISPVYLERG